MYVYLTGGTGFVGSYLLDALLANDHRVRCLVRSDPSPGMENERVDIVRGSITEPETLRGSMEGCEAVIHLVGIIEEHASRGVTFEAVHDRGARNVVDEARQAGIRTFIHMSANGARADGVSAYQTTKWSAESYVRAADFERWTVLRPSVIFGDPGPDNPEFAKQLATTLIKPFPILPVFGDGRYEMQPVHVSEVADAFVQSLTRDAAAGSSYCVAGREAFPYLDILDRITRGMGLKPKRKVHQPVWLVRPVVHTIGRVGLLPISPDQFEMLLQGNTCDSAAFYRDFDVTPVPFTPENLAYLQRYV